LLLFLLLLEWLRPLPELADITDIYLIYPFVYAIAGFIVIDYLRITGWLGWPMKLALCLLIVGYMFSFHKMPSLDWFESYAGVLRDDAANAWRERFTEVSAETRTLIFLLGWALMISVIQSLMVLRQHGMWFVVSSIVYLLLLQMYAGVDTLNGLVRTVCIGLGLLALLNLPRVERRYAVAGRKAGWPAGWLAFGAVLIAGCIAAGWFGSGAGAKEAMPVDWSLVSRWADYVTEMTSGDRKEDSGPAAVLSGFGLSGYGEDDSRLGGPLRADERVVFTALSSRKTYWRGEAKSYYDGKGWSETVTADVPVALAEGGEDTGSQATSRRYAGGAVGAEGADGGSSSGSGSGGGVGAADGLDRTFDAEPVVQEVMFTSAAPVGTLFVGGPIEQVDELVTEAGQTLSSDTLRWNAATGKYSVSGLPDPIAFYRAKVRPVPQASKLAIGKASAGDVGNNQKTESEEELARYLQLPDELPQRVALLAKTVTAAGKDPMDRAMLLENYLKTHYEYSLDQPKRPPAGEDFVDDFLFRQKLGYCDYFSTAMVVMLRSVGIPARWVKGYAPGEVDGDGSEEAESGVLPAVSGAAASAGAAAGDVPGHMLHITVRNSDAHSWAEAYLPGVGWVGFEPTPGFTLPAGSADARAAAAAALKPAPAQPAAADAAARPAAEPWPQRLRQLPAAIAAWPAAAAAWLRDAAATAAGAWRVAAALALAAPLAWAAWRQRHALALRLALRGYRRAAGSREQLLRVCERLWLRVFRLFGGKPPQLTLREYIASLAGISPAQRQALIALARMYEAARYGEASLQRVSRRQLAGLWRGIVKPHTAARM
jgi:transglutaminase-like putative cysteine protease